MFDSSAAFLKNFNEGNNDGIDNDDDDNNDTNKSKTIYLSLKSSCRAVDVDGDSSLSSLCDLLQ